jgi:hypothetical protein
VVKITELNLLSTEGHGFGLKTDIIQHRATGERFKRRIQLVRGEICAGHYTSFEVCSVSSSISLLIVPAGCLYLTTYRSGHQFVRDEQSSQLVVRILTLSNSARTRRSKEHARGRLLRDSGAQLKLHDDSLWDALATSEHQELQDAYEYLKEWRHWAGLATRNPLDSAGRGAAYLTRILEDTGYIVSVSADNRPQQAMANVEKFREQLREWSDDGVRSLTPLVNRIERRIELGGRESEADLTGDGVQILTIHDAKGMEFPFVVVPGIGREFKDEAALGGGKVEFEQDYFLTPEP